MTSQYILLRYSSFHMAQGSLRMQDCLFSGLDLCVIMGLLSLFFKDEYRVSRFEDGSCSMVWSNVC
jgi:hypothetical protein